MNIKLSKIANLLSCDLNGPDREICNVTIDSREVKTGDFFVALEGKKHDGHDYIQESIDNGALAILCNEKFDTSKITIPYIVCQDTLKSLGVLARGYKSILGSPFTIGITGTNGKTTVTQLTTEILNQCFSVSTTLGNYNNDIGLPLSILKSPKENYQRCIYELGASKKDDISYLVNICEPDMTTLLNVSEAHMESFGSFETLMNTKEEIFSHSNTDQVVLNKDDKHFARWENMNKQKKITTISISSIADYYFEDIDDEFFYISTPKGKFELSKKNSLKVLAINLLFSIALAMEAGANIQSVKDGIKKFSGVQGRFYSYVSSSKSLVIDDSYNANPESMKSSLNQLRNINKNKVFIMGDMGELGERSLEHHLSVFRLAKDIDVKHLLYMGKYKNEAKSIFGDGCRTFDDIMKLIDYARSVSDESTVVLIKASRFMNFDIVAKGLK
tara:strand:+ start:1393 stop:2727 length:1335 start_codon:yes stop_codon:yes gene_type:complete